MEINERQAVASAPEDAFVELFAQVFGLEKVQLLVHEYSFEDIYGAGRYIDYAIRAADEKLAFEIDGLTWHHPGAITAEKFESDLLRQNSLVHQGWRVFRWTDRELLQEPERVKEELALFLQSVPGLSSVDDFLPKQTGAVFELREHQKEALDSLAEMLRRPQDNRPADARARGRQDNRSGYRREATRRPNVVHCSPPRAGDASIRQVTGVVAGSERWVIHGRRARVRTRTTSPPRFKALSNALMISCRPTSSTWSSTRLTTRLRLLTSGFSRTFRRISCWALPRLQSVRMINRFWRSSANAPTG